MLLAARLCPDPLGEHERSPGSLAGIRGRILLPRGKKREGEENEKGRGREGIASSLFNFWLRANWRLL